MANASGNITCPVDYVELLNLLGDHPISGADVAAQCPDVCSIAWGEGNPDLSGIGAYTSYIIQTVFTLLFQMPFIVLYIWSLDKRRKALVHFYEVFVKTYALFNLSVLLASLVRTTSSVVDSGYELVYVSYLVVFCSTGMLALSSTPVIIKLLEPLICADEDYTWPLAPAKLLLFAGVAVFNFTAASYRLFKPPSALSFRRLYPKLADMCQAYAAVHPPSEWIGYVWFASCVVLAGSCTVVYVSHLRRRRGRTLPRAMVRAVVFSLVVLFLAIDALFLWLFARLRDCRGDLKTIMGPDFEDSRWGFGQVLALFLWIETIASLLWAAGTATVRKGRTWSMKRQASQGAAGGWPDYAPGSPPHELHRLWMTK
ncbi:hypothetical protein JX266_005982 [Neoarthrinium moseri]|nr:hypothetical protein JX266_005982 [Neoarthrinium moseri]